jgi:hypothetical protein
MLFELLAVRTKDRIAGLAWHERTCAGFTALAAHRIARALGMPVQMLAELIGADEFDPSWGARGRALDSQASSALYRIARAYSRLHAALKSKAQCARWLHTPNKHLGGHSPLLLLLTAPGSAEVEAAVEVVLTSARKREEAERREAREGGGRQPSARAEEPADGPIEGQDESEQAAARAGEDG